MDFDMLRYSILLDPRRRIETMSEPEVTQTQSEPKERVAHSFRNLRELVDFVAGESLPPLTPEEGRVTEQMPFPFLSIVGQQEMKLALLLGLINPNICGILVVCS